MALLLSLHSAESNCGKRVTDDFGLVGIGGTRPLSHGSFAPRRPQRPQIIFSSTCYVPPATPSAMTERASVMVGGGWAGNYVEDARDISDIWELNVFNHSSSLKKNMQKHLPEISGVYTLPETPNSLLPQASHCRYQGIAGNVKWKMPTFQMAGGGKDGKRELSRGPRKGKKIIQ